MSDASANNAKNPAVRLGEPTHRVLSILAARRGVKIKQLVEEIVARDPGVQAQAEVEGIKLESIQEAFA